MARRYDAEFKDRAVRLLADSRANYTSETKALEGVAKSLGVATESLRRWRERSDTANTADPGGSEESGKLRRENAELRRANGISGSASAFSAGTGSTRHGIDGRAYRRASPPARGRVFCQIIVNAVGTGS